MHDISFLSQIGQDKFIIEDVFNWKKDGYFVDIGAYDGITISNTYILEKEFDWQGICIEPSTMFEQLITNRSCHCENVCLSDSEGEAEFVECGWDSSIKGFGKHNMDAAVTVKTTRLASVLQKYNAPDEIDYLSIDVEGMEYEILKNFCFDEYLIRALTVEHNNDEGLKSSVDNLLLSKGYECVLSPGIENWYLHESVQVNFDGRKYAELYFKKWHELWGSRQNNQQRPEIEKFSLRRMLGL